MRKKKVYKNLKHTNRKRIPKNPYLPLILALKKLYNQKRHEELLTYYYANDLEFLYNSFRGSIVTMVEKELKKHGLYEWINETICDLSVEFFHEVKLYDPEKFPYMHFQGFIQQRLYWKLLNIKKKIFKLINHESPWDNPYLALKKGKN